jgi:hypothetical protein
MFLHGSDRCKALCNNVLSCPCFDVRYLTFAGSSMSAGVPRVLLNCTQWRNSCDIPLDDQKLVIFIDNLFAQRPDVSDGLSIPPLSRGHSSLRIISGERQVVPRLIV